MSRRSRSLALLGVSAVCAGTAASFAAGYEREVRAQVGPLVPVCVARKEIPRGTNLTPGNLRSYVEERRVPARFVPPGTLSSARQALGLRSVARMPAGSYVERAWLGLPAPERAGPVASSATARLVELPVAGAEGLAEALAPGAHVDVLITSGTDASPGRTYLALQRIELLDFRSGETTAGGGANEHADGVAMLRVTVRQAVLLAAAQNFAREVRLLPRPRNDRRRLERTVVRAGDLHP